MALKVPQTLIERGPSFCSHFEFEFYQNDAKEEMVQILFDKTPVQIEGASSPMISKSEILKLTNWVRRTADQHANNLKNYKPDFANIFVDPINTPFE